MIDLDALAERAVNAPVADPPELAELDERVRHRRRRHVTTRVLAGTVVVALLAVIGWATVVGGDDGATVSAPSAGSNAIGSRFATRDLVRALSAAGARVDANGAEPLTDTRPLYAPTQLLCVDGVQLQVYEYRNRAARIAVSDTIGPDGSTFTKREPGTNGQAVVQETIVDWLRSPNFYSRGRVIALALGNDPVLLQRLTDVLGPTITPRARQSDQPGEPCLPLPS